MDEALLEAVLARLGTERPAADLDGLRVLYAAWCRSIPFDNTLKLVHIAEGRQGPLPGSSAAAFFGSWLEHGTGGTCWAGNGALHALLVAVGFDATRAIATMLPSPEVQGPNHGSVVVGLEGEQWIADASILSGAPIRIRAEDEPGDDGPLPRFARHDGRPAIEWRMLRAPDGFPCRIERIGAEDVEWDALHQRTATWSPFNYQLSARIVRDGAAVGIESGRRYRITAEGVVEDEPVDEETRVAVLVEELGLSESLARRIPADRPVPPRPAGR